MHELFRARRRKTNVNIALKEAGETVLLSDLLMWNKIGRIVTLLSQRLDVSGERALDIFYTSRTNERLHDEHTGLYLMSDLYIVDEVIRELRNEARAETK